MLKLTMGQTAVLALAAAPMAAVGIAGGVATFVNMNRVLDSGASALGMVAAGEGAVLIASLVALAVTLMGQHTPVVVRLAMWLLPLAASGAGIALAPDHMNAVVMGFTPMAMTAAGEGVAFVARRVVAYRTGVDIEQQRRSGLLLWHANRAANGKGLAKWRSEAAVWRLTKQFAATDNQMSVQLGEVQRYRIGEGADQNLAAVLSGQKVQQQPQTPAVAPAAPVPALEAADVATEPQTAAQQMTADESDAWIKGVLAEAEQQVATDTRVKLLTVQQVADLKGVAAGTVRSWKHRGKLPVFDTVDGSPQFHPNDVAKLD